MKKVIRYNAFETNSSSMHTVTVRGKRHIDDYYKSSIKRSIDEDGNIITTLDEYGWYGEPLTNFWEKLPYALLMVLYTEYSGFDYYNDNFTIDQDEGTSSMYIDLVTKKYGVSSLCKSSEMYPLMDNIIDMFKVVKENSKVA